MNTEATALRRIDPRVRWLWTVQRWAVGLPVTQAAAVLSFGLQRVRALETLPLATMIGLALLLLVLAPIHAHLSWRHFRYGEADDGLLIERGVCWRRRTLVPHSRIQHSDVKQGPLERRLGLATLLIYTAATRHGAVTVPGLAEPLAEALRRRLSQSDGDDAL